MSDAFKNNLDNSALAPELAIERIYIKDLSYEAPSVPQLFLQEWQPEMNLELHTHTSLLTEDRHEVVLTITVTVKSEHKTAFLVEIKQAGIFLLKHFNPTQLHAVLGSVCPNLLYPYAREAVSSMVTRGGFPQLLLAPVNFDALYAQHLQQQQDLEKPLITTIN